MRVSKPVRSSISLSSSTRDAAEPHVAERVGRLRARSTTSPSFGVAPSATTTIENVRAAARGGGGCARRPRRCRTGARGRGSRRRRRPCRSSTAIQPAWRPMTSTTITRLCDSAVVCRRSIASVAICTAVWKPNVKSVPARSLSIVFGTPTTSMPSSCSRPRDAERVLAADRDQRVEAVLRRATPCTLARGRPSSLYGFVREVPRIVPPRCRMPRVLSSVSVDRRRRRARRPSRSGSRRTRGRGR